MALPTVVVGLIGYALLSRSAPMGFLNLMFSPKAVILGEFDLTAAVDAHLKNLIMHHQVMLPVTEGQLDLGPWQQVFYAEFFSN